MNKNSSPVTTSVIIPCYNVAGTLGLQLECLFYQRGAEPFEVLVVDNGSRDRTVELARSWSDRLNVRVVDAAGRRGVSYARNRGVGEAAGSKLIFLDGDDAVPEDYLHICQRTLDEAAVYAAGFDPVDAGEFAFGREHVLGVIAGKSLPYQSPVYGEADMDWPIIPGGSFGIRRELMQRIGGFDVSMDPGAEDNDLAIRLERAGYPVPVQRSTTIAYRVDFTRRRPFGLYRRRAKSVALLLTRTRRWGRHPVLGGVSAPVRLAKTLLVGLRVLVRGGYYQWLARVAHDVGLCQGYVVYRVFDRLPPRGLGEGMGG